MVLNHSAERPQVGSVQISFDQHPGWRLNFREPVVVIRKRIVTYAGRAKDQRLSRCPPDNLRRPKSVPQRDSTPPQPSQDGKRWQGFSTEAQSRDAGMDNACWTMISSQFTAIRVARDGGAAHSPTEHECRPI
jgi:hypothetical protein